MKFCMTEDGSCVRVETTELQQPGEVARYRSLGFYWLRKSVIPFVESLRNPVVGCYVDLFLQRQVDTIPIDSARARDLIHRIAPF